MVGISKHYPAEKLISIQFKSVVPLKEINPTTKKLAFQITLMFLIKKISKVPCLQRFKRRQKKVLVLSS